jgi:hypothetical protein
MAQMYLADDESEPFVYLMESVSLNGCPLTDIDVTAEQYLQFAARDLQEESERGAVNALGNIKRALHQTVDSLLQGYGLLARNRRLSFPKKLELIDAAGLFSLSILRTLNNERNLVEHDYRVPGHARAQEALDVVRLWLLAARRLSEFVVYEALAEWRDGHALGVVQLNPALGLISLLKSLAQAGPTRLRGSSTGFCSRSGSQGEAWLMVYRSIRSRSGVWRSATGTEPSGSHSSGRLSLSTPTDTGWTFRWSGKVASWSRCE